MFIFNNSYKIDCLNIELIITACMYPANAKLIYPPASDNKWLGFFFFGGLCSIFLPRLHKFVPRIAVVMVDCGRPAPKGTIPEAYEWRMDGREADMTL